jgi:DNA-binding CsgD family transcriptional regulator
MQRAIQVNRQLLQLEIRTIATSAALDRMPISIILVDMTGKPVYSNQQAQKLSLVQHGFSVKLNRLASSSTQNLNAIHKLVHRAITTPAPQSGVHAIQLTGSTRPLTVLVTRISSNHQFNLGTDYSNIGAALFISNPDQATDFPVEILNRLYGLTPAENRLIVALVNGDDLRQIAENLDLSKNTIRNQLKSCFRKTGTKRQSELVALILSSVPILACLESTIQPA